MTPETKFKVLNSIPFKTVRKVFWDNSVIKLCTKHLDALTFLKVYSIWQRLEKLNIDNPKTYTDKLQWVKLNVKDPQRTLCADKYKVREYVVKKLGEKGEDILNEIYGVYSSVDQIDIEKLPKAFVLKANHGSGWNIIVKDKDRIDWDKANRLMKKWLSTNYYYEGREWQYKDIPPRIVCEKYLENSDGSEINDYKFMCFNGKVESVWVDYDRHTHHVRNFYDLDGSPQFFESDEPANYSITFEKPENYEEMIEIATKLCEDFNHTRVDLYNVDGKIYFGELTFTPFGGMSYYKTHQLNVYWGDKFVIDCENE